jgi:hypothetical protein
MKFIFSIALIFSLVLFSHSYIMGGYQKSSFNSNDARINSAFKALRSTVLESSNSQETVDLIPVGIYTQLVNGINYKIIAGKVDSEGKTVNLVTSVVFVGFKSPEAILKTVETLPTQNHLEFLEQSESSDLKKEIQNYFYQRGSTLVEIVSIESHPNLVIENDAYYIIKAFIKTEYLSLYQFLIVNEEIKEGKKTYAIKQVSFAA